MKEVIIKEEEKAKYIFTVDLHQNMSFGRDPLPVIVSLTEEESNRKYFSDIYDRHALNLKSGIYYLDNSNGSAFTISGEHNWFSKGYRHRLDGPAYGFDDDVDSDLYFLFGHQVEADIFLSHQEYFAKLNLYLKDKPELWPSLRKMFESPVKLKRCIAADFVYINKGNGKKAIYESLDYLLGPSIQCLEEVEETNESWKLPVAALVVAGLLGVTKSIKSKTLNSNKSVKITEEIEVSV